VGSNLVELSHAQTVASPIEGFCSSFYSGDLKLREKLFDELYLGANCNETVATLGYQESTAAVYDPLSEKLTTEAICEKFNDEIALLKSVGNESPVDGLRFSYEVSFTEDNSASEFNTYAGCIEMDA